MKTFVQSETGTRRRIYRRTLFGFSVLFVCIGTMLWYDAGTLDRNIEALKTSYESDLKKYYDNPRYRDYPSDEDLLSAMADRNRNNAWATIFCIVGLYGIARSFQPTGRQLLDMLEETETRLIFLITRAKSKENQKPNCPKCTKPIAPYVETCPECDAIFTDKERIALFAEALKWQA
ncbi:MAG: hypothetical protein L6R28_05430 [Planctomycetes bacterium]|nr:hypothetical protein [Planctomycetota bacterium]